MATHHDITNPIYQDADKARAHLEAIRWPDGPVCPHCGSIDQATRMQGKAHRKGLYQCQLCRKQFSVTVGTVFERSRVPLNKWLLAVHLMAASKKGYSAHQLHRTLGVTYKTAWFMFHRIREAMREGGDGPMGGGGGTIEADETFWGHSKRRNKGDRKAYQNKEKVMVLVERENGRARSFHVASVGAKTLSPILKEQIAEDANLVTDESHAYTAVGKTFASHKTVNHGMGEYVKDKTIYTNTAESFFSLLKRGLVGTFHHVSPQHLKRYCCEFDFRWNYRVKNGFDDVERAEIILRGIQGKRLLYKSPRQSALVGFA